MRFGDNDSRKDFNEAYNLALGHWQPWLTEARQDLQFAMGDQWTIQEKAYLDAQRRAALVFNRLHRVLKLIEGYQRKNRMAFRVDPVEGSDEQAANQFSGLLQALMTQMDGYNVMSDAFAGGALKTGLNLIQLYLDYSDDPLNGDIRMARVPYNRCLLDPMFTRRDLTDCAFVIRRDFMRRDDVLAILPSGSITADELESLHRHGGQDNKFTDGPIPSGVAKGELYTYDSFWRRRYEPYTIILDRQTGQSQAWGGGKDDERLIVLLASHPSLTTVDGMRRSSELITLVEGEPIYTGPDPTGLDDYPLIPILGFFDPECEYAAWKLQGVVRCMRDPQIEVNKRRSQMLDMISSQISSGWTGWADTMVNPEALYQSGQGQVNWVKADTPPEKMPQKIVPADIPQGFFALSEVLDRDIMEIPGANAELMGTPENPDIQMAGILAKMRSAQGLTVLQDIFDNYRLSKKLLGQRLIRMIQVNYSAEKIRRILGEDPAPAFSVRDFGKYDCVPCEGVLTDTQRQMYFSQLLSWKQMGAPIPWSEILDVAPLENKDKLKKAVQEAEQAQAGQGQQMQMLQQLQTALLHAQIAEKHGNAERDRTQAQENMSSAVLDRIKTAVEISEMKTDNLLKVISFIKGLQADQGQGIPGLPGMQTKGTV